MKIRSLLSIPKQAYLGTLTMPHVGPHPGIGVVALLILLTGVATINAGGMTGFFFGIGASFFIYVPFLLIGSVSRARISDRLERRERVRELLQAWIDTEDAFNDLKVIRIQFRWLRRYRPMRLHTWVDSPPYKDLPPSLSAAIQKAMTAPMSEVGRIHEPTEKDMKGFGIQTSEMSAHDKIKAHGVLSKINLNGATTVPT